MPLLADKIAFAERHVCTKEGVRWSLKGREWVRDQFWLPADGFKLWRHPEREACATCLERVGEIVEHPADNPTRACACGGLVSEPILVTVALLERGDGKTFNLAGYSLATIFKGRNKHLAALWSSEDQGTRVFGENWLPSIEREGSALASRCTVSETPPRIYVPSTGSTFKVRAAGKRSAGGSRLTHVLVDEARDVEAATMMALLPSTNAMHGVECPDGHVQLTPEDVERLEKLPETCAACGKRLVEWWPRIILASAAGVLSGTERDWLYELVEELQANPHPNYHLFTSASWGGRALNPRKSAKVTAAIESVFGKLPSTRHYVAAEYGNEWTQKGEDVLTATDVKRVMDRDLHNEEGSPNRAVAFLDTSTNVEKTSLVILCEDQERSGAEPWSRVYLSYLEFWWPGHGALRGVRKVPEADVKRCLETVLPMYPHLVAAELDPAAGVGKSNPDYLWPIIMLREIRNGTGAWRKLLRSWSGGPDGADIGWDLYEERVVSGTIRLQQSQEILDEHKGLMRSHPQRVDARPRVVDRNRAIMHQDITRALANACWLIKREQLRSRRGGGMAERLRKQKAITPETQRREGGDDRQPVSSVFGRLGPNAY